MLRWKDKQLKDLDGKKIAKYSGTYAILFVALGAMTFFGVCSPNGQEFSGASLTGAAATVDGHDISSMEFRRAYQNAYSRYQSQFSDNFDPAVLQLSKMVLNQLVNERITFAEADRNGIFTADDEVEKVIADAEVFKDDKGQFSGERFDNFLKNNRYSEKSFTDEIKRNLTGEKMRRFLSETYRISSKSAELSYLLSETKVDVEYLKLDNNTLKLTVSDEDVTKFLDDAGKAQVKEYYEKNKKEFSSDKKIKARHILTSYKEARNASGDAKNRSKDDARKKAEGILKEVQANPAGFDKLATKYTDDASGKNNGGDLGLFDRNAMVKEFSDAAFALSKGQVSGIVESPFGFHIIKVEDIQEAKETSLEAATQQIARKLIEKDKKPKFAEETAQKIIDTLKENKTEGMAMAKALGLEWKATGEFAADATSIPGIGGDKDLKSAIFALSPDKPLYTKPVDVAGAKYLIRLKSRKDADLAQLTPEKRNELLKDQSYMEAYSLYTAFNKGIQQKYTDGGKVWMNPEFRDFDQNRKTAGGEATGGDAG